jgi:DNA-binding MarR family transcriptional regulator
VKRGSRTAAISGVIDASRALFHQLKAAEEEVHRQEKLTGGLRGVMQELRRHGPRTVPQMARARPVSRQHIQVLVNELRSRGLVELRHNPEHKRSKLVALTAQGIRTVEAMLRKEEAILAELPLELTAEEMATATRALESMREAFRGPAWNALVTGE